PAMVGGGGGGGGWGVGTGAGRPTRATVEGFERVAGRMTEKRKSSSITKLSSPERYCAYLPFVMARFDLAPKRVVPPTACKSRSLSKELPGPLLPENINGRSRRSPESFSPKEPDMSRRGNKSSLELPPLLVAQDKRAKASHEFFCVKRLSRKLTIFTKR